MKMKTIVRIFVILLVVGVIVGTLAYLTDGFKNWDVTTWFTSCGSSEEDKGEDDKADNKDDVVVDNQTNDTIAMPRTLAFSPLKLSNVSAENSIAEYEPKSVWVSVNYEPEDTTNKQTSWSLEWITDNTDFANWAKDKNVSDYVTVKSVDATTAELTCLQPFGAEICLTCISVENQSLRDSCRLLYSANLLGFGSGDPFVFKITYPAGSTNSSPSSFAIPILYSGNCSYSIDNLNLIFSDYTFIGQYYVTVKYSIDDDVAKSLTNYNAGNRIPNDFIYTFDSKHSNQLDFGENLYHGIFGNIISPGRISSLIAENKRYFNMEFTVMSAKGEIVSKIVKVKFDTQYMGVAANSMAIDRDTITF